MRKFPKKQILSIIPANGWHAIYNDNEERISCPLVCWALVTDENGDTYVVGMDGENENTVDICEETSNFDSYSRTPIEAL